MKYKADPYRGLILLFLIIETCFFSLTIFGEAIYAINSNQQGILAVITVLVMLCLGRFKQFTLPNLLFGKVIFAFIILYIIEFVYSTWKYNQGAGNVFIASNYCLIILLYFCLAYYFRNYGVDRFNEYVVNISMINMLLHLLQYFLIKRGVVFLFFNDENSRMGNLRLGQATNAISFLGVVIALAEMLSKKDTHRIKNKIVVALGVISFVYVSRGRAAIIGFFITCIAMICFTNRKNIVKILGVGVLIIVIGFCYLSFTELGQSYVNSLSEEDTMSYRLVEMEYYWDQVKDNPVLGVGFIRRMGFTWATQIITGPRYHYSRTDVGIVGFANIFGLLGIIWFIYYQIKIIKYIKKITVHNNSSFCLLIFGVFIWNIAYTPTMILFGVFSICIQAILMAYIDYYYYTNIKN